MNLDEEKNDLMKVLVVDDNKDNVELICQILEEECKLVTANSGKECLQKAEKERPDLILLDVNMPEMDGYETIQRIKQTEIIKDIPVIFVSAYYKESDMVVKGLEQGAFDYLTKPVDEDILLAKVHVVKRIKQAEEKVVKQKDALEQANLRLSAADKLKSIFLASMSHELRTPLNSIIGFTSLMLMEVPGKINEAQKEQLTRVKRNGDHLLELINDVLDISKIEAGKVELNISEFNLSELMREMTSSIQPEMDVKGLKLIYEAADAEVIIKSDRRRLQQIIMNFFSNALKFTEQGEVICRLEVEDSGWVTITVEDSGVGIKVDDMKRLFEPFQQISMDYTNNYKGTGLGLYLCEKLSHVIGASIEAKSEYGEGSQFSITLPPAVDEGVIQK